jgi:hypothetical protein
MDYSLDRHLQPVWLFYRMTLNILYPLRYRNDQEDGTVSMPHVRAELLLGRGQQLSHGHCSGQTQPLPQGLPGCAGHL